MSNTQKIIAETPVDFVSTETDLIDYLRNQKKGVVVYNLGVNLQLLFATNGEKIAGQDFKHRRSLPVELKKHLTDAQIGEISDIDQPVRRGSLGLYSSPALLPELPIDIAVKKITALLQLSPEQLVDDARVHQLSSRS